MSTLSLGVNFIWVITLLRKKESEKVLQKNLSSRCSILAETQLASYKAFLQKDNPNGARKTAGLQAAFESVFPIASHNGFARLDFVEYALGESMFDVRECQQRGLTFASPLRAKVRLVLMDREAAQPTVKEVKEQEVYMGEIPSLLTTVHLLLMEQKSNS